jgi:hypothetical protein
LAIARGTQHHPDGEFDIFTAAKNAKNNARIMPSFKLTINDPTLAPEMF